jgi:hypothetical protein
MELWIDIAFCSVMLIDHRKIKQISSEHNGPYVAKNYHQRLFGMRLGKFCPIVFFHLLTRLQ